MGGRRDAAGRVRSARRRGRLSRLDSFVRGTAPGAAGSISPISKRLRAPVLWRQSQPRAFDAIRSPQCNIATLRCGPVISRSHQHGFHRDRTVRRFGAAGQSPDHCDCEPLLPGKVTVKRRASNRVWFDNRRDGRRPNSHIDSIDFQPGNATEPSKKPIVRLILVHARSDPLLLLVTS